MEPAYVATAEPLGGVGVEDREARSDITAEQLPVMLRRFYGRAFADELLGPVFIAHMDLDAHLPVITDFWSTVLFRTATYRRNALTPHKRVHSKAPLTPAHFERWLAIWCDTVDERYAGPVARTAKVQATRIASAMTRRVTGERSTSIDAAIAEGAFW